MSPTQSNQVARWILAAMGLDESKATRVVLTSQAGEVEVLEVTYYTHDMTEPPEVLKFKVEPL